MPRVRRTSSSLLGPGRGRMVLALYVVVALVHLGALLRDWSGLLDDVTQDLLMPLLAAALLLGTRAPRGRLVRLVLVALGFSWLGDALPDLVPDDVAFLVMVGCFLLAQLAYVAAFLPAWRASPLARSPRVLAPYAVALAALVAACGPNAGVLLVPVVVYGVALTAMAVTAVGIGRLAAVGGTVFLVSDALIALREFASLELPAHGFWVMATYILGQALLVLGVAGVSRQPGRVVVGDPLPVPQGTRGPVPQGSRGPVPH